MTAVATSAAVHSDAATLREALALADVLLSRSPQKPSSTNFRAASAPAPDELRRAWPRVADGDNRTFVDSTDALDRLAGHPISSGSSTSSCSAHDILQEASPELGWLACGQGSNSCEQAGAAASPALPWTVQSGLRVVSMQPATQSHPCSTPLPHNSSQPMQVGVTEVLAMAGGDQYKSSVPFELRRLRTASLHAKSRDSVARTTVRSSDDRSVRLGVRLLCVSSRATPGPDVGEPNNIDTPPMPALLPARVIARMKCENTVHTTGVTETMVASQNWGDFYAFDVKDVTRARLHIALYREGKCWKPTMWGHVRIDVRSVLGALHQGSPQPECYALHSHMGRTVGQIMVQLYFASKSQCRDLKVLCGTWNVGNKPPPSDLSPWLVGVDSMEHDLVAIGVQECHYAAQAWRQPSSRTLQSPELTKTISRKQTRGDGDDDDDDDEEDGQRPHSAITAARNALMRLDSHGGSLQRALARDLSNNIRDVTTGMELDQSKVAFREVWEALLKKAMGPSYSMVSCVHMGQIRLAVFARFDMLMAISDVASGSQATGVGGVATNKGGVAVAMKVWETELCFVNCHLAAHQSKITARNAQYRDIVRGLKLYKDGDILCKPHHVFWMGDLNYRVNFGTQAISSGDSPTPFDFESMVEEIEDQRLPMLLEGCQLRQEMGLGTAFVGFNEPDIKFPPTFKVSREKGIRYVPQRSPAWCDRILHRSNLPHKQAIPVSYFCAPDVPTSDHKPVSALYTLPSLGQQAPDTSVTATLVITHLSASGLSLPKMRRPSGTNTCALRVMIQGSCLKDESASLPAEVLRVQDMPLAGMPGARGGARPTSLQSPQRHASGPVLCLGSLLPQPLKLPLKPASMQALADERIMICLVSDADKNNKTAGGSVLACGMLPMLTAAQQLAAADRPSALESRVIRVRLERHGVRVGTLELECEVVIEAARRSFASEASGLLKRATSALLLRHLQPRQSVRRSGEWAAAGQDS